ncbi:MAG: hypothetical protein LLF89_10725 [Spirochaetaceae bacterium]|nr:hypothetical protein [Spirochaetaceae bacterium]
MSKKTSMVIFMIIATIFNVAVTALLFIGILWLYSITLAKLLPQTAVVWAVLISFVVSLILSVVVYQKMLGWARKKYNLDERLGLNEKKKR